MGILIRIEPNRVPIANPDKPPTIPPMKLVFDLVIISIWPAGGGV